MASLDKWKRSVRFKIVSAEVVSAEAQFSRYLRTE